MQLNDTTNLNGIYQDLYFNGKITVNTFSANDLLRIANKYYKIAQSDIRAVNEDFFGEIFKTDWKTTTGGTYPNEYVLDSTYEKVKQLRGALNPTNPSAPLETEYQVMNLITVDQITDPSYQFSVPTAVVYDSSFLIFPSPTQTITNGLEWFAIVKQPDLALNTDTPNIFADYHDVITWGSLIDIGVRLGKPGLVKMATEMYTNRRAEMKAYASERSLLLSGNVIEGQKSEGGWSFPFGKNQMS